MLGRILGRSAGPAAHPHEAVQCSRDNRGHHADGLRRCAGESADADCRSHACDCCGGSRSLTSVARELATLYDTVGSRPLWVDEAGHPTADAHEPLGLLSGAATEALDPADYDAPALEGEAGALENALSPTASSIAGFDIRLSEAPFDI